MPRTLRRPAETALCCGQPIQLARQNQRLRFCVSVCGASHDECVVDDSYDSRIRDFNWRLSTFRGHNSRSRSICLRRLVVAGASMLQLRHAKYATRSISKNARKDRTLFRPTTSGPGKPR